MRIRKLNTANTALLVIDIQEKLLKIMNDEITQQVLRNTNQLIRMFRHWNSPILVTEQYVRGLGHTSDALLPHLGDIQALEKVTFSCCSNAPFNEQLEGLERPNIIVTGMETHICVLQTTLDLLQRNYSVYVMADAVQSSTKLRWEHGLKLMEQAGAVVMPTETLLFQLLGQAGTSDFKHFLNMLKETN
ncbi:MAG: isochorismatase family protein [SAR324 cluster bacterium]|nr:isochorismatase family protein [SAR324 cluster bacterium]